MILTLYYCSCFDAPILSSCVCVLLVLLPESEWFRGKFVIIHLEESMISMYESTLLKQSCNLQVPITLNL